MKAARILFLALIILSMLVSIVACIGSGGGGGGDGDGTSGDEATAAYGAEQFHQQLTAISQGAAGTPQP